MDMTEASVLYLICSDRVHSGKTLLARLLVDWLLLKDIRPLVIDLDVPVHPLAELYPDISMKVDFDHTLGRVELFDGIVSQPDVHRVLELPVLHMEAFLREARNLEFFEAITASGSHVVFMHFVDDSPAFVDRARQLAASLPSDVYYCPVRSVDPDDLGKDVESTEIYKEIRYDGELQVPRLAADVVNFIEQPEFSFAALMKDDIAPSDVVLRFKLQQFVKTMFAQFNRIAFQIEVKTFKKSGIV